MLGDSQSRSRFILFPLAVIASTAFLFQGCIPNRVKTDDESRPELYGKEILKHAEDKDQFEDQILVYLQMEADMWREMVAELSAALDSLNAFVRDSTQPLPGDFVPKDCPGPDCDTATPPPGCKIRPDCN